MKRLTLLLLAALAAGPAAAHDPRPGPNGGTLVDAGTRYHAELVANGSNDVVVFLSDANDRPVPVTGYRANAILVVNGQTVRFPLQPGEGSRLQGSAPVAVPARVRGAVQIIAPDGGTAQARF